MEKDENSVEQAYKKIPLKAATPHPAAKVLEVKKLDVQTKSEIYGPHENRNLIVKLGIECRASLCEKMDSIELVNAQSSIESALNPSDFYIRVETEWKPGCATGQYGDPQFLELELEYHIGQRKASEKGKPWPKPNWRGNESVRHLSFDSGMLNGFNTWRLYRLDYTDLDNITFKFIKKYAYVQGDIVEDFC